MIVDAARHFNVDHLNRYADAQYPYPLIAQRPRISSTVKVSTFDQLLSAMQPGRRILIDGITIPIPQEHSINIAVEDVIIAGRNGGGLKRETPQGAVAVQAITEDRSPLFVIRSTTRRFALRNLDIDCRGFTAIKVPSGESPRDLQFTSLRLGWAHFGIGLEGTPQRVFASNCKLGTCRKYPIWLCGEDLCFAYNTLGPSIQEHAVRGYGWKNVLLLGNNIAMEGTDPKKAAWFVCGDNLSAIRNTSRIGRWEVGPNKTGLDHCSASRVRILANDIHMPHPSYAPLQIWRGAGHVIAWDNVFRFPNQREPIYVSETKPENEPASTVDERGSRVKEAVE